MRREEKGQQAHGKFTATKIKEKRQVNSAEFIFIKNGIFYKTFTYSIDKSA